MKQPPTPKAWSMRRKLQALAERGIDGEKESAIRKLAILEARYRFGVAEEDDIETLFTAPSGVRFDKAGTAAPLCIFVDHDIGQFAKWAIENGTGIECIYRYPVREDDGMSVCADAVPAAMPALRNIAETVRASFTALWEKFRTIPGAAIEDKSNFMRGLYDGMMVDERRQGERLPTPIASPLSPRGPRAAHHCGGPKGYWALEYAEIPTERNRCHFFTVRDSRKIKSLCAKYDRHARTTKERGPCPEADCKTCIDIYILLSDLTPSKKTVGFANGVAIHPYPIAVELGRKIRLRFTVDEVIAELETEVERLQQFA